MASKLSVFIAELKRRKVHRVALGYALVGIGVIEGTQLVFDAIGLPFIAWRFVSILVLLGFPVALVLAWVLEITSDGIQKTPDLSPETLPGEVLEGRGVRTWAFLGASVVLVVATGYFIVFRAGPGQVQPEATIVPTSAVSTAEDLVAVFEFQNLTGDSTLTELGLVTQHQVTAGLSWAEEVNVVPATTVLQFRQNRSSTIPDQEVAAALGAAIMVTGVITSAADRLQFQAQITRLGDPDALPVVQVTSPASEPMAGIEELRDRVMGALAGFLSTSVNPRAWVLAAPPYEAVRAHLLGFDLLQSGDLAGGLRLLHEAYARDESFFAPLVLASYIYQLLSDGMPTADSLVGILQERRGEMSLDEQLWVDFISGELDGDWERQLGALRGLATHDPGALVPLGSAAIRSGRPEEALAALGKLDPTLRSDASVLNWESRANLLLGRTDEALRAARRGKDLYPADLRCRLHETRALASLGRLEELKTEVDEIEGLTRDPLTLMTPGGTFLHLASHLVYIGEEEEAQSIALRGLDWFQNRGSESLGDMFQVAQLHILLNQPAEALDILRPVATVGVDGLSEDFDWEIAARGTLGVALAGLDHPYLRGLNTFYRSVVSAHLDLPEEAVEILGQGWDEGHTLTGWDFTHPLLAPLFDYGPFQQLVQPKG
jgi:TolB-like protein